MSSLEAIILGLIQGLTEFLPVSSSGHLAIGQHLLGISFGDGQMLAFDVMVHVATVCATVIVFRRQILDLLAGLFKFQYNPQTRYVLQICLSLIPVMVVGLFFKDYVEQIFGSGLMVVGIALLVTAVLLLVSERISRRKGDGGEVNYRSAFIIGLAQAVAVIPGLSRSGATISTGLLCGVRKDAVAQFSFLMVLVPVLGEAFLDVVSGGIGEAVAVTGVLPLVLGFLSAFISGLFACKVMIHLVRKASLHWFSLYCAVAALYCIISALV